MPEGARMRKTTTAATNTGPFYPAVGSPSSTPASISRLQAGMAVHMIGIGGTGMRGAAAILLRRGLVVSGSDQNDSAEVRKLAAEGVRIRTAQSADALPEHCDLVVYSAAIKDTNPELMAARERGLTVIKYAQLLGLLMADRMGIALAGTHGKSTTTAMTSFILREAGFDPCFVVGAQVPQLGGSSGVGDGQHFVVEACEFDRSYLNLHPRLAAILNVEEDHLDYYRDLDEIVESFSSFARRLPADGLLVVNADSPHAMKAAQAAVAPLETFALNTRARWNAAILGQKRGCYRFTVLRDERPLTDVELAIPGLHHVSNALAAMALTFRAGIEPETVAKAISGFKGAERRLTWKGCVAGVNVVDDYAHHPTELQVTIQAAREYYSPRKLFVVFQPHQHSRTRFLLDDFARSFESADVVVVPDIFFVRDSQAEASRVDSKVLVDLIRRYGRDARYQPSFQQIVSSLCAEAQPGDLVITMGAGDIWRVADGLLTCLGSKSRAGT